jgi:hypothetical protein
VSDALDSLQEGVGAVSCRCAEDKSKDLGGVVLLEPVKIRCPAEEASCLWI